MDFPLRDDSTMDLFRSETKRILEAAEVAMKDNNVSRMHDLITEYWGALARADLHPSGIHPFSSFLVTAIENDWHEMAKLLLQNGAKRNEAMLYDLVGISKRKQYAMLETLLSAGFDINTSFGYSGDTLLMNVNSEGIPMLKLLLKNGADPNLNVRGARYTSIELAALFAGTDVIDVLLDNGAQLQGRNSLHRAADYGRVEIVEHLLDRGVDIDGIPDNEDVYDTDRIGTALHSAATYEQKDVVVALLRRGADKSLKDSEGQTALEIAEAKGYTDIVRLLE